MQLFLEISVTAQPGESIRGGNGTKPVLSEAEGSPFADFHVIKSSYKKRMRVKSPKGDFVLLQARFMNLDKIIA